MQQRGGPANTRSATVPPRSTQGGNPSARSQTQSISIANNLTLDGWITAVPMEGMIQGFQKQNEGLIGEIKNRHRKAEASQSLMESVFRAFLNHGDSAKAMEEVMNAAKEKISPFSSKEFNSELLQEAYESIENKDTKANIETELRNKYTELAAQQITKELEKVRAYIQKEIFEYDSTKQVSNEKSENILSHNDTKERTRALAQFMLESREGAFLPLLINHAQKRSDFPIEIAQKKDATIKNRETINYIKSGGVVDIRNVYALQSNPLAFYDAVLPSIDSQGLSDSVYLNNKTERIGFDLNKCTEAITEQVKDGIQISEEAIKDKAQEHLNKLVENLGQSIEDNKRLGEEIKKLKKDNQYFITQYKVEQERIAQQQEEIKKAREEAENSISKGIDGLHDLSRGIQDLYNNIKGKKSNIPQLRDTGEFNETIHGNRYNARIAYLNENIKILQGAVQSIEGEEKFKGIITNLQGKVEQLTKQISNLNDRQKEDKEKYNTLEVANRQSEQELKKARDTVQQKTKQYSDLLEQYRNLNTAHKIIEEEHQQLTPLKTELANIKSSLSKTEKKLSDAELLASGNAKLKERNTTLESEKAQLLATVEHKNALIEQQSKVRAHAIQAINSLNKAKYRLSGIWTKLFPGESFPNFVEKAESEEVTQEEIQEAYKRITDVTEKLEKALGEKEKEGEDARKKLEETQGALGQAKSKLATAEAERDTVKKEVEKLTIANETLTKDRNDANVRAAALGTENTTLRTEKTEAEKKQRDAEERANQSDKLKSDIEAANDLLGKQLKDAQKEKEELDTKIRDLTDKLMAAGKERDAARGETQEARSAEHQARTEVEVLQQQNNAAAAENSRLNGLWEEAKQDKERANIKVTELNGQLEDLRNQAKTGAEDNKTQIATLAEKIGQANAEKDEAEKRSRDLEEQIRGLEEAKGTAELETAQAKAANALTVIQLHETEAKLKISEENEKALRNDLVNLGSENDLLKKQLAELQVAQGQGEQERKATEEKIRSALNITDQGDLAEILQKRIIDLTQRSEQLTSENSSLRGQVQTLQDYEKRIQQRDVDARNLARDNGITLINGNQEIDSILKGVVSNFVSQTKQINIIQARLDEEKMGRKADQEVTKAAADAAWAEKEAERAIQETRANKAESDLATSQARVGELEGLLAAAKIAETTSAEQGQQQQDNIKQQLQTILPEGSDVTDINRAIEAINTALQAEKAKVIELDEKLATANTTIGELKDQITAKDQEIVRLSEAQKLGAEQKNAAMKQLGIDVTEGADLAAEIAKLKEKRDELQISLNGKTIELIAENARVNDLEGDLKSEREGRVADNAAAEAARIAAAKKAKDDLEAVRQTADRNKETMQQDLDAANVRVKSAEEREKTANTKIDNLNTQLLDKEAEIARLSELQQQAEGTNKEAAQLFSQKDGEKVDVAQAIIALQQERDSLQQQLQTAQKANLASQEELYRSEVEKTELREAAERAQLHAQMKISELQNVARESTSKAEEEIRNAILESKARELEVIQIAATTQAQLNDRIKELEGAAEVAKRDQSLSSEEQKSQEAAIVKGLEEKGIVVEARGGSLAAALEAELYKLQGQHALQIAQVTQSTEERAREQIEDSLAGERQLLEQQMKLDTNAIAAAEQARKEREAIEKERDNALAENQTLNEKNVELQASLDKLKGLGGIGENGQSNGSESQGQDTVSTVLARFAELKQALEDAQRGGKEKDGELESLRKQFKDLQSELQLSGIDQGSSSPDASTTPADILQAVRDRIADLGEKDRENNYLKEQIAVLNAAGKEKNVIENEQAAALQGIFDIALKEREERITKLEQERNKNIEEANEAKTALNDIKEALGVTEEERKENEIGDGDEERRESSGGDDEDKTPAGQIRRMKASAQTAREAAARASVQAAAEKGRADAADEEAKKANARAAAAEQGLAAIIAALDDDVLRGIGDSPTNSPQSITQIVRGLVTGNAEKDAEIARLRQGLKAQEMLAEYSGEMQNLYNNTQTAIQDTLKLEAQARIEQLNQQIQEKERAFEGGKATSEAEKKELQEEVNRLVAEKSGQETKLTELIRQLEQERKASGDKLINLSNIYQSQDREALETAQEALKKVTAEKDEAQKQLNDKDAELAAAAKDARSKDDALQTMKNQLSEAQEKLTPLQQMAHEQGFDVNYKSGLDAQVAELKSQLETAKAALEQEKQRNAQQQQAPTQQGQVQEIMPEDVPEFMNERETELQKRLNILQKENEGLRNQLDGKAVYNEKERGTKGDAIIDPAILIAERDEEIGRLKRENAELKRNKELVVNFPNDTSLGDLTNMIVEDNNLYLLEENGALRSRIQELEAEINEREEDLMAQLAQQSAKQPQPEKTDQVLGGENEALKEQINQLQNENIGLKMQQRVYAGLENAIIGQSRVENEADVQILRGENKQLKAEVSEKDRELVVKKEENARLTTRLAEAEAWTELQAEASRALQANIGKLKTQLAASPEGTVAKSETAEVGTSTFDPEGATAWKGGSSKDRIERSLQSVGGPSEINSIIQPDRANSLYISAVNAANGYSFLKNDISFTPKELELIATFHDGAKGLSSTIFPEGQTINAKTVGEIKNEENFVKYTQAIFGNSEEASKEKLIYACAVSALIHAEKQRDGLDIPTSSVFASVAKQQKSQSMEGSVVATTGATPTIPILDIDMAFKKNTILDTLKATEKFVESTGLSSTHLQQLNNRRNGAILTPSSSLGR